MGELGSQPSEEMMAALSELWRVHPPGPDNILAHPAFVQLREACRVDYPSAGRKGPNIALATALRALGLPCYLQKKTVHLGLPVEQAATKLDAAMRATHATLIHLAPLDLAAELPHLSFGSARVCRLDATELLEIVDACRLKRLYPQHDFDAEHFSQFHWLIVQETIALEQEPEARSIPFLFADLSQDLGRIEPHEVGVPSAVEDALFFLLLAPWESWSTMLEVDWRSFRIPWVYTVNTDIFVRPSAPPLPGTLSWEPRIYDDGYGGTYEEERPVEMPLEDCAEAELAVWNDNLSAIVEAAKRSVLFETPIEHFLVRAFLAAGVDEFLAHITTIEAGLGLRADYQKRFRIQPDRHKGMRATDRMRSRIVGLLGDGKYAGQFERVFDLRSAFLHGRNMAAISSEERVIARSLARKVVKALVDATQTEVIASREDFLDNILDQGVHNLQGS